MLSQPKNLILFLNFIFTFFFLNKQLYFYILCIVFIEIHLPTYLPRLKKQTSKNVGDTTFKDMHVTVEEQQESRMDCSIVFGKIPSNENTFHIVPTE